MSTGNTYSPSGFAVHGVTITANAIDTVQLARDFNQVEVTCIGLGSGVDLFVTVDGTDPTVGGRNTWRLVGHLQYPSSRVIDVPTSGPTVVKLIADDVTTYSVVGIA